MTVDKNNLKAAAEHWIAAWNARDLDAILEHYPDDVVFYVDTAVTRWNRPDGMLRSKVELREHFRLGLERAPNLHFELLSVLSCPDGYAILYKRDNGNLVVDAIELNDEGYAAKVHAYYAGSQA